MQQTPRPLAEIAVQELPRVAGLEVGALDAKHVGILVAGQFASEAGWVEDARVPIRRA